MDGKVLIDGCWLRRMVPVMKAGSGNPALQWGELPADIGMDERGLNDNDHNVDDDGWLRKPQ